MSDNNKPWVVDIETRRQWGLCNDRDISSVNYKPYAECWYPGEDPLDRFRFVFEWQRPDVQGNDYAVRYEIDARDSILTWTQQTYDLPTTGSITIDIDLFQDAATQSHRSNVTSYSAQERFETEAEAIEFAESQSATPIITFNDGDYLFRTSFRQRIEGVWIDRTVGLQHTGDTIEIHNVTDLENYYASAMGMDTAFVVNGLGGNDADAVAAGVGCSDQYLDITIFNVDNPVASTITVEPDFQGLPSSSSITIIDGDPVVSGTMLENGDGSVTVSDNGNISMLNDGGTFFLNEFGNVGFFANGDASLTANTQVQLGSGGTTFNVDSNGLNMRDSTGTVSFTADELSRLKELLGE